MEQNRINGVWISRPFPFDENKQPQGFMVGSTKVDMFSVENTGNSACHLQWVRIAQQGWLRGFHGLTNNSSGKPSREVTLDVKVNTSLRPGERLLFTLTFSPKEVGLHTARILCDFDEGRVFLNIGAAGENADTRSIAPRDPYVRPKWIRCPNPSPRNVVPGVPPPFPKFPRPLKAYKIPPALRATLANPKQVPRVLNQGLSPATHHQYFTTLLFAEEFQMMIDIQAFDMKKVTMRAADNGYLALKVPGLAEQRPSVFYGDSIYAREATVSNGKEYEGYVHDVLLEEVYLRFHSSFHQGFVSNLLFDIHFAFSRTSLRRAHQALEPSKDTGNINIFCFPEVFPARRATPRPQLRWINRDLNEQQKNAVTEIVSKRGVPPYIIFGPPGTGKTVTVTEAILQVRQVNKEAIILVCAPSNTASDLILLRLIGKVEQREMLRLNAFSRSKLDVPIDVRPYCNKLGECPSLEDLKSKKVIVTTCMSASLLHAQGMSRGHFTHIFIDEAGQSTEPDTLVSIAHLGNEETVVILAGDHQQLGPVIRSPLALKFRLDKSLLERLISSPPFAAGRDSRFRGDLVMKLLQNYRSHPSILKIPSELFYRGQLIPSAGAFAYSLLDWEYLPNKKFPVLFIGVEGADTREGQSPSWFNPAEASKVKEIVQSLRDMRKNRISDKDIGVISPYRQQVKKIKALLGTLRPSAENVTVGTVEQFQGQERRAIIISTVRSKHDVDILSFDKKHNLGFLSNPKRFNVAMTRAQALLVVIGNPAVLSKDPCWRKFMLYCLENKSWKGCPWIQAETDVETGDSSDAELILQDQPWPEAV